MKENERNLNKTSEEETVEEIILGDTEEIDDGTEEEVVERKMCIHITHNDADALGCAVVQSYSTEYETHTYFCAVDEADYVVNNYFFSNSENPIPHLLLISDIAISEETAAKLEFVQNYYETNFNHKMEMLLIDHHTTNKLSEKHPWCIVASVDEHGVPISAAKLMLNVLGPSLNPEYIPILRAIMEKISRYDTWEWKRNPIKPMDEEYFNIVIKEIGIEKATEELLHGITPKEFRWSPESLRLIAEYLSEREEVLEKVPDQTVIINYAEYTIGMIFPHYKYFNECLEKVYESFPEVDFSCGIDAKNRSLSFRTNKTDINLARFAKRTFGGGGHPQASGAKLNTDDFFYIMRKYYYAVDERKKAEARMIEEMNNDAKLKYPLEVANQKAIEALEKCIEVKTSKPSILFADLITEHLRPVLEEVLSENQEKISRYMLSMVRGILHETYVNNQEIRDDIDVTSGGIDRFLNQFYLVNRLYDAEGNEVIQETEEPEVFDYKEDIEVLPEEIKDLINGIEDAREEERNDDIEENTREENSTGNNDINPDNNEHTDTSEVSENPGLPEDGILYEDLFGGEADVAKDGKLEE